MSHTIEPIRHYTAGESKKISLEVQNSNLNFATEEWYLLNSKWDGDVDAVIDHTDSNVTTTVDNSNDLVEVDLDPAATTGLGGADYWHRLKIEDAGGDVQIWGGKLTIVEV
jgi:hypothetical protein